MRAFNERLASFEQYGEEDLRLIAFFHCNGCEHGSLDDPNLQEKIQRIVEIRPESLENEYQDIRNLAMIFDKTEKAEEIISKIQADDEIGKKAAEGKEPQKILILESWKGEYDVYPVGYGLAYTPGIRCGSTVKMFLKYLCGIE